VHVLDVAQACRLALTTSRGTGRAFNVGSGQQRTVLSIAEDLAQVLGCSHITPHVLGKYRAGDIRHCFADIEQSRAELGFVPRVDFRTGLAELAEWLSEQVAEDGVERAAAELESRGLVA
jgi:dTDP-L-rhamnose 4-epimerase